MNSEKGPAGAQFTPHVAIVGGGVTGLSTAWYLQQLAPQIKVTLFEASAHTGGKIITHYVDGDSRQPFVLEAGADAFLARQKPWAYQLALDLGLADRLLPTDDSNSGVYVVNRGALLPLPKGLNLILPTDWEAFERSPLMSAPGKARVAQERDVPARRDNEDESVAEFVTRRLGREALEKLGEPLLSGIYSAHPEEQSILATFPRFREMEQMHGSLLRAMEAGRQGRRAEAQRRAEAEEREGKHPPLSAFVSFVDGTQALPTALAKQIKAEIHLTRPVRAIEHNGEGYRLVLDEGTGVEADAVVLAIPARSAAALLRPLAFQAARGLDQLRTVSSGAIYLAYRRDQIAHAMNGFGVVIPRAERRDFNALTWVSSKFAHRVPTGHALIRLFFGGARTPHMMEKDDAEIERAARQELQDLMGIGAVPLFHRVFRWWDAQPQYDVGHLARIAAIEAALPPTLFVVGTAYGGVGIPDCVHQGHKAAQAVLARLPTTLPKPR